MTFTILPRHVWNYWKPPKVSQSHLLRGFFTQSWKMQVSWCHYLINIPPRKQPFCWGRECAWLLLFQLKSRKRKRLWFALPQNMLSAFVAERRWCVSGGRTGKCLAWREICGLDGMIWRAGSGGRELYIHTAASWWKPGVPAKEKAGSGGHRAHVSMQTKQNTNREDERASVETWQRWPRLQRRRLQMNSSKVAFICITSPGEVPAELTALMQNFGARW